MPRFNEFSTSHSYFSWLMGKKEYTLDARIKGGERHMIMGIYEVAPEDFAICEFVCSSKMELQRIVREGLDMLRREMC